VSNDAFGGSRSKTVVVLIPAAYYMAKLQPAVW